MDLVIGLRIPGRSVNMEFFKAMCKYLLGKTKDYCDNCSIQGLKYITEANRHITERYWYNTVQSITKPL